MDPSNVLKEAAFVHERDEAKFDVKVAFVHGRDGAELDVGVARFIVAFLLRGENAQCVLLAKYQCLMDEVSG